MSQYKRKSDPAKKDCHFDLLLNSGALALFCLLNKPSTHKHAEWSGKSSLTLVTEVTSRAEMAACHFPCQGDICHCFLSCFLRGREGDDPSPQQGWPSPPIPAPLSLLLFFQKGFHFSFGHWSLSFRRG